LTIELISSWSAACALFYREHRPRRLVPSASHLATSGHHLLMTRDGPLDVLGTIGNDCSFDHLVTHSSPMRLGRGLRIQLLDLPTLIETKEQTARSKDVAVLEVLRQTLADKRQQKRKKR
jgi:hypothetical protein